MKKIIRNIKDFFEKFKFFFNYKEIIWNLPIYSLFSNKLLKHMYPVKNLGGTYLSSQSTAGKIWGNKQPRPSHGPHGQTLFS